MDWLNCFRDEFSGVFVFVGWWIIVFIVFLGEFVNVEDWLVLKYFFKFWVLFLIFWFGYVFLVLEVGVWVCEVVNKFWCIDGDDLGLEFGDLWDFFILCLFGVLICFLCDFYEFWFWCFGGEIGFCVLLKIFFEYFWFIV